MLAAGRRRARIMATEKGTAEAGRFGICCSLFAWILLRGGLRYECVGGVP